MEPTDSDSGPTLKTPEAFYDHYMPILVSLGTAEGGLSQADAQNLAHDVLLSSIVNARHITNMRMWLTAAMRAAARSHREPHAGRR